MTATITGEVNRPGKIALGAEGDILIIKESRC